MLRDAYEQLLSIGVKIPQEFYELQDVDAPLLHGVRTLLAALEKKDLKLTAKGYLPMKMVEALVGVSATVDEKQYDYLTKRFYENEHYSAALARAVCEQAGLTKVRQANLSLTKKGHKFLQMKAPEQFILVFHVMLGVNIGFFDGHQEALCVHNISHIMLQVVRDKHKVARCSEVYTTLLVEDYNFIYDEIDSLEVNYFLDETSFEVFTKIVELRLFKRFYLPLGLVYMNPRRHPEEDEYEKTELLESFYEANISINTQAVLLHKKIKTLQKEVEANALSINLLEVMGYLFSQLASVKAVSQEQVIDSLVNKDCVIGSLALKHKAFYEALALSVQATLEQFTQLDGVGVREDLVADFESMIKGFVALVPFDKPFVAVQSIEAFPVFILDILSFAYKLDMSRQDFIEQCSEVLGEEMAMDIGQLLMLHHKLLKDAKKLKKCKPNFKDGIKEFFQAYMIIVFELRSMV